MKNHPQLAFSLIEILIVLSLIAILCGIFLANFSFSIEDTNDEKFLNNALKTARNCAIKFQKSIILKIDRRHMEICDTFGKKILNDNNSMAKISSKKENLKNCIQINTHGFFYPHTIKFDETAYDIDILSGCLIEKTK